MSDFDEEDQKEVNELLGELFYDEVDALIADICFRDCSKNVLEQFFRGPYSQTRTLLRAVAEAAIAHAKAVAEKGKYDAYSDDRPYYYKTARWLASNGIDIIKNLESATSPKSFNRFSLDEEDWVCSIKEEFWPHRSRLIEQVRDQARAKRVSEADINLYKQDVEHAAESYLRLPYRVRVLERLLVDMLMASEIVMYADEMFRPIEWPLRSPAALERAPLQQTHVLISNLTSIAVSAAILIPLVFWIGGGLLWLWIAFVALEILLLPFFWRAQHKRRKRVLDILMAMREAYRALDSDSVISARYVREKAMKADELGVAWPSLLFAVLDDNISRDGRL